MFIKRCLFLLFLMAGAIPVQGHLFLYENVECNLHDPKRTRIEFSIHAPELPTAMASGIDPAAVDDEWIQGLDEKTVEILKREAETFIRDTFLLQLGDREWIRTCSIEFESIDLIRQASSETNLSSGCLLATVWIDNPKESVPLTIGFAPSAQKRLMVAIARPAAFPEVHDLAPGESVGISLPIPPPTAVPEIPPEPPTAGHPRAILWIALMIFGIALGSFFWRKQSR